MIPTAADREGTPESLFLEQLSLVLVGRRTRLAREKASDGVMGSLGLKLGDSRGYEAYIEGRVLELASKAGRKEFDEEWKSLRSGWFVGDGEFGEALAARLEKALKGRRRESHSGDAKAAHGETEAERRLQRGLS